MQHTCSVNVGCAWGVHMVCETDAGVSCSGAAVLTTAVLRVCWPWRCGAIGLLAGGGHPQQGGVRGPLHRPGCECASLPAQKTCAGGRFHLSWSAVHNSSMHWDAMPCSQDGTRDLPHLCRSMVPCRRCAPFGQGSLLLLKRSRPVGRCMCV